MYTYTHLYTQYVCISWYQYIINHILHYLKFEKRNQINSYMALEGASLVAQLVKKLSAVWETWVRHLG